VVIAGSGQSRAEQAFRLTVPNVNEQPVVMEEVPGMGERIWSTLEGILFGFLYPVVVAGIFVYFIRYISSLVNHEPAQSPLELAAVAAALGGLILLGAFLPIEYTTRT
jgi:hypothetical protein